MNTIPQHARVSASTPTGLWLQRKCACGAPAAGLGDGDDRFHEGFETFVKLIDKYQPRYHLHGHQHLTYSIGSKRIMEYNNTTIVNAYNYYILEMEFPDQ